MSFVVDLDMEEGESTFFEGEGEIDEEIESGIGLTKVTLGNSIFLDEAMSDCDELDLRRTPSSRSGRESISSDSGGSCDEKEGRKIGGHCHRLYRYWYCCSFCTLSLWTIFILCVIFFSQQVELCLKLHLDDKDIMQKVLNDEGRWGMNVINPNNIDVYIYGLAIKAYYGGVQDENLFLQTDKRDFHIPAHGKHSSNQSYIFVENSTAAVSIQTFTECSMGYRASLTFDMVTSFEACVLKFVCRGMMVKESVYRSNCSDDEMVCTKLEIFQ